MNSLFRQQCYLLGEWRSAPQTMTITNPFNDEVIGTVPNMGEKETQEVIAGADKAFQQFKALTAQETGQSTASLASVDPRTQR